MVAIEEEVIEAAGKVVMVRDVALSAANRVTLLQAAADAL